MMEFTIAKSDKRLSLLAIYTLFFVIVMSTLYGLKDVLPINLTILSYIFNIILLFIILYSFNAILKNIVFVVFSLIITSAIALTNILFFPNTSIFFTSTLFSFITNVFPFFVAIYGIQNLHYFKNRLILFSKRITYFVLVVLVVNYVFGFDFADSSYLMGFGYSLLIPICVLFEDFYKNKKFLSLFYFLLLFFIVVIFASRGPIVSIFLWILYVVLENAMKSKKSFGSTSVAILLIAVFFVFGQTLLHSISTILSSIGVYSRTISILVSQSDIYLSGRDIIYSEIYHQIMNSPFILKGINADYLVIGQYSHNIVLEVIYEFGLLLGSILLILLFTLALKSIFMKSSDTKYIVMLLLITSLPILMFSGTVWTSSGFWAWICLTTKKRINKTVKNGEFDEKNSTV